MQGGTVTLILFDKYKNPQLHCSFDSTLLSYCSLASFKPKPPKKREFRGSLGYNVWRVKFTTLTPKETIKKWISAYAISFVLMDYAGELVRFRVAEE